MALAIIGLILSMASLVLIGLYLPWVVRKLLENFSLLYWVKTMIQLVVTMVVMMLVMLFMAWACFDSEVDWSMLIVAFLVSLYAVFVDYVMD